MIARHETTTDKADIWARIAAPLPEGAISWRQDGRPAQRDGKFYARFVAYVDSHTVRERLDSVVPGEWDLTLDMLPTPANFADDDGEAKCAFKARLQVLGVIREDVGQGSDYKQAATDAFKRAAVRFGIAHELYSYGQNWVQVDGDGKYAKPVEDPGEAYARKLNRAANPSASSAPAKASAPASPPPATPTAQTATDGADDPSCPKCGGRMWDNRISKRNSKAPDFKCRSRSCDGVVWPPRGDKASAPKADEDPWEDRDHEPDDLGF